ncbi:MAG: allophanate hydrolase [Verrucomicrobiota bacterium]
MNSSVEYMGIDALRKAYQSGSTTPRMLIEKLLLEIRQTDDWMRVWIHLFNMDDLESYLSRLETHTIEDLPLFGVPFAIKDNIDLAGIPTTAACPEFAYTPEKSAFVVQKLTDAGAIPLGKTNMDQFATGLVGTRSPYGACPNAFDVEYISGGSSSGSAVAVAHAWVSFSLGTDTAGSGRVPAGFNNLIGLKPTHGALSTSGVVPACRSLDCVSIFALTAKDAQQVFQCAAQYDEHDVYARPIQTASKKWGALDSLRIATPQKSQLNFWGETQNEALFKNGLTHFKNLGHHMIEADFSPLLDAAALLYQGPWVAERYVAIRDFLKDHADAVFPVTRQIIEGGAKPSAADTFKAMYRLKELKRASEKLWENFDLIITPTVGKIYKMTEVANDPIQLNTNLGYYTNFMNLLDLSAVAVPVGFDENGLPFGATLIAPAHHDVFLLRVADAYHRETELNIGKTKICITDTPQLERDDSVETVSVAVCGAHLEGFPLNAQLTEREASLKLKTTTSENYRFYALAGGPPYRPGLIRDEAHGACIEVEVWDMPLEYFGSFVAGIPQPLGIGKLELADGTWVSGFICEGHAIVDAKDITEFGSWRHYMASLS